MKLWIIFCLWALTACASMKPVEESKNDIQISYQINREEIRKAIRSHLPEIQKCYEKSLKYEPHLKGQVAIEFELKGNGQVQRCDIKSSTLKSPPVEKCVCERISEVTFSTIPGDSIRIVDYPFIFDNGE